MRIPSLGRIDKSPKAGLSVGVAAGVGGAGSGLLSVEHAWTKIAMKNKTSNKRVTKFIFTPLFYSGKTDSPHCAG